MATPTITENDPTSTATTTTEPPAAPRDAWLGRALIGASLVGVAVAVAIGVLGFGLIDRSGETVATSLSLTADAIATVEDTVELADETVASAAAGLATLGDAFEGADGTLADIAGVMRDTAVIVGEDVPVALDAIRTTMPALIESADLIGSSLGALSFLGVDFEPPTPPGDSLREIDRGLAEMSAKLSDGSVDLDRIADDFDMLGGDVSSVREDLDGVIAGFESAAAVLDGYESTAAEAAVLVDASIVDLRRQLDEAKLLALLVAFAIGIAQVVPFAIGLRLLRARPL